MNNYTQIILVDVSYVIFYRFFATLKWYSIVYKEDYNNIKNTLTDYNWLDNNIFISKLEKIFFKSITDLFDKQLFNETNIYFCFDATNNNNVWRKQIFENYKINRINLCNKYNLNSVFNHIYNIIISIKSTNIINYYTFNHINSIQHNNLEADDIIACICLHMRQNKNIYILSADKDFYQLGSINVFFIDFKTKVFKNLTEEEAKHELNKKIIYGDKSDCIPSIVTNKSKKKLLNEEYLSNFLKKNIQSNKQYELNTKLINFKSIPEIYYTEIITQI
uniref:5'-3' exonuclease domain-containing protein n=1 Tax=viral metagenome TaxID=1070528 RepID=A0A6C0H9T5_9ZZZZ